jgi:hypothetical protein
MDQLECLLSISEVAERYSKTEAQIRYAVKQERLRSVKLGWQLFFKREELPNEWPITPREKLKQKRGNKLERH